MQTCQHSQFMVEFIQERGWSFSFNPSLHKMNISKQTFKGVKSVHMHSKLWKIRLNTCTRHAYICLRDA